MKNSKVMKNSSVIEIASPQNILIRQENLDISSLGPNKIYAETIFSAISPGTETAAYIGLPPLRPCKAYPRLVGYCNLAEIKEIGRSVEAYKPGDLILTFQSHRSTFICESSEVIAKVPGHCNLSEASKTYLFHLGYNALLKGNYIPGHTIAIVGLGTLGTGAAALASLFGAQVFVFSNRSNVNQVTRKIGFQNFRKDLSQQIINEITNNLGVDLVINTSNSWEDWQLALQLARRGGTISVIGFPGRGQSLPNFNPLDSQYFYDKQLTIVACGYSPRFKKIDPIDIRFTTNRNCKYLLQLILDGLLDPSVITSSIISWKDIERAYKKLLNHESPENTFILDWNN